MNEPGPALRPLPITIVPGMSVVEQEHGASGIVVGVTEACCIYRLDDGQTLCVSEWRKLAVGPVCPAAPLLPREVEENDRRNAGARVLSELLGLQRLGALTPTQQAALDELVADLCSQA